MAEGSYRQFCPVAMASEILATRWTIVLLRELISGSTRFNDLRRGVTWPFSQPDAGVQGRSLWRRWFEPNGRRIDQVVAAHYAVPFTTELTDGTSRS